MLMEAAAIGDRNTKLQLDRLREIDALLEAAFPGATHQQALELLKGKLGLEPELGEDSEDEEEQVIEYFGYRDPQLSEALLVEFKAVARPCLQPVSREALEPFRENWERKGNNRIKEIKRNMLRTIKEKKSKGETISPQERIDMLKKIQKWDKKLLQKIVHAE
jgi:hypothetical protein